MRPCHILLFAVWACAFANEFPCENCHGPKGDRWVAHPVCQSCHQGETRYSSAFDAVGQVRTARAAVFGLPPNTSYKDAKSHGGLPCADCHGAPHDHPKMKVVGE